MTFTAKGEVRREALLDAVLRVLESDGPGAVTHRAVATEAGVPLSAATYYFATIDDLYVSALKRAASAQAELFRSLGESGIDGFARALYDFVYVHRGAAIAQYELMFLAMRRQSLRADAELWYRALEQAIDPQQLHPRRTRVASLAVDGLLLRMLWIGEPSTVPGVVDALREITSATSASAPFPASART